MSSATASSNPYGLLAAFLMEYDHRIDEEQACVLVRAHKCKFCRTSFVELSRRSQALVFLKDSRGVVHELCSECARGLRETDADAKEINFSKLEGDVRRTIFNIMVGELRHTKFREGSKAQVVSSTQQSEKSDNGKGRKPVFVRKYPVRYDNIVFGR